MFYINHKIYLLIRGISVALLMMCVFSTSFANLKLNKIGTVVFTDLKDVGSIGLSGVAANGGLAGLIASGGTLAVTYTAGSGDAVITGDFAGNLSHYMYRGMYHLNNVGSENLELTGTSNMVLLWNDADGYYYDAQLSGTVKILKAGLDKYLATGSIGDEDYYEVFTGTLKTNNPNRQDVSFQSFIYESVGETVKPDGKTEGIANLYLIEDK